MNQSAVCVLHQFDPYLMFLYIKYGSTVFVLHQFDPYLMSLTLNTGQTDAKHTV